MAVSAKQTAILEALPRGNRFSPLSFPNRIGERCMPEHISPDNWLGIKGSCLTVKDRLTFKLSYLRSGPSLVSGHKSSLRLTLVPIRRCQQIFDFIMMRNMFQSGTPALSRYTALWFKFLRAQIRPNVVDR